MRCKVNIVLGLECKLVILRKWQRLTAGSRMVKNSSQANQLPGTISSSLVLSSGFHAPPKFLQGWS